MIDDPLRPYLDRVAKIRGIGIEIAEAVIRATKISGNTSADLEEAAECLKKAREFQDRSFELMAHAARSNAELEAELIRASKAPEMVERLADTEAIIRMTEELLAQSENVFARLIIKMPAALMPLAIQETSTYQGGPEQLEALGRAIEAWKQTVDNG